MLFLTFRPQISRPNAQKDEGIHGTIAIKESLDEIVSSSNPVLLGLMVLPAVDVGPLCFNEYAIQTNKKIRVLLGLKMNLGFSVMCCANCKSLI